MPNQQLKNVLRDKIKSRLDLMSPSLICENSKNIVKQFLNSTFYKDSSRIAVYSSLPKEVQTKDIMTDIFLQKKECFIPRYTKTEMSMVKVHSMEDWEKLPVTKWNIKQPLLTDKREDAFLKGGVDLVVVPGLGFTKEGHRLGRGKGYYDKYLESLYSYRAMNNLKRPSSVGLAFNEQIVETIPTSEHDFMMDKVIVSK